MNNQLINFTAKGLVCFAKKYYPEILVAFGSAGMFTAGVFFGKGRDKAKQILKENESEEKLSPVSVIKATWKCYIPAITIGAISAACIVGSSSANLKRNAALATAYTLSESALKEYRDKVKDVVGDKKEQEIRDEIAKDQLVKNPVVQQKIIATGNGSTLCFDPKSGRYFYSDIDRLHKAENEINRQMRNDAFMTLNDFYYELGLDAIDLGESVGWNIDKGYLDLQFSSQLSTDYTPCIVIDYNVVPNDRYL